LSDGDAADDNDNAGFNIESCMYCEECCDPQEDGIMPLEEFRADEKRRKRREWYAKKKAEYVSLKQKEEKGGVLTEEEVMKIQKFEDAQERRRQRDAEKKAEYVSLKQKEEKGGVLTEEEVMKIQKFEDAQERRRQRDAEKKAEYVSLKQKEEKGGVLTEEEVMKIQKFEDAKERRRESISAWYRDKFGYGGEDDSDEQKGKREEKREHEREYKREYYQDKREKEGYKFCPLPDGRRISFQPSTSSNTAEQQLNCEDQPYFEQDSFREYFENGLVRALREYNSVRVVGNLALMSASQLKVFHDYIRIYRFTSTSGKRSS
jgi:hypothetical protein